MAFTRGKLIVEGSREKQKVTFTTKVVGPVGGEIVTEVSDPISLAAIAREILSALPVPEPLPVVEPAVEEPKEEVKE